MGDTGPEPADAETTMAIGGDDPVELSGPAGSSTVAPRTTTEWTRRRIAALVVVVLAVAGAVVATSMRSPESPVADLVGRAEDLPGAPSTRVEQRWDLDLGPGDAVGLVGHRVVVVEDPRSGEAGAAWVTARHVRSKAQLWREQLSEPSRVLLVAEDGSTTTTDGDFSMVGGVEDQRLVALAADDGRMLWEREVSFVIGSSSEHVLLATPTGCELVDVWEGRTTWEGSTQGCQWLDEDEVVVRRRGEWEVHGVAGGPTRPPLPGTAPPAGVGDSAVAIDDDELVMLDRDGATRWRRPTGLPTIDDIPWPQGLPGVGVLVTGWDDTADELVAEVVGLDGTTLDIAEPVDRAWVLDVGGRSHLVGEDIGDHWITMTVRPTEDLSEPIATMRLPRESRVPALATDRGMVVPSSSGEHVELRRWPDLAPLWTVDLTAMVATEGGWDHLITSERGLVVVSPGHRGLTAFG